MGCAPALVWPVSHHPATATATFHPRPRPSRCLSGQPPLDEGLGEWDSRASQKFLSPGGAGGLAEESICALGEGSLSFLSGQHTGGASRHSGFSLGVLPAESPQSRDPEGSLGARYGPWGATQQRGVQAQEAASIRGEGRGRGDPGSMGTLGGTGGRGSCLHKVARRAVRLRANPWTR